MSSVKSKIVMVDGRRTGYAVTKAGEVLNRKTGRALAFSMSDNGYPVVFLQINGRRRRFKVHRLVARAFIRNPKQKPFVNHKDGDKTNPARYNLEWSTVSENTLHAIREGLFCPDPSCARKRARSTPLQADPVEGAVGYWFPYIRATAGFCRRSIHRALTGEAKTHRGFYWQRVDICA